MGDVINLDDYRSRRRTGPHKYSYLDVAWLCLAIIFGERILKAKSNRSP